MSKEKKNKGANIAKYIIVSILILSMIASVFAYLIAALQTI